ncbi:hypothetical protein VKS41_005602 [Umbelopsis sp. WA50703]
MQWRPFSSNHTSNDRPSGVSYSRLSNSHTKVRPNKRCYMMFSKAILSILVGILSFYVILFRTEFNARVYIRDWVYHKEIENAGPLSECFNLPSDSQYIRGYSHMYEITPGVPLVDGFTCYDFAATIQPRPNRNHDRVIYHSYFDTRITFDESSFEVLRSFFATQDSDDTGLYLWTNNLNLISHPLIQKIKAIGGERFQIELYQPDDLALGTPLQGSAMLETGSEESDVMKLLILYRFGGVWFNDGVMFVRDMSPLFEHEWISQGNCANANGFDSSMMRFRRSSPYLCEMLHEIGHTPPTTQLKPQALYSRIHRRLLQNAIRPWAMMPWCFTDPQACTSKLSLSTAFVSKSQTKERMRQIFAFNSHQKWDKKTEWIFQYLKEMYQSGTTQ